MNVAFINENTMGHASYLMPFVRWFEEHPEAGITPHVIHATPLPPGMRWWSDTSIPGLRSAGLDFHNSRWRLTISQHVRQEVDRLLQKQPIDALIVNTQSVALHLTELASRMPLYVCLDGTFHQLASSHWFAPNMQTRFFLPLTLAPLRGKERDLFLAASVLCPWSADVAESLALDYHLSTEKIRKLPPSLNLEQLPFRERTRSKKPRILFLGGDFARKGGAMLLELFREFLVQKAELHIVTHSFVEETLGVTVHRGVKAYTPEWQALWEQADMFVFPSTLETFGLVLLEAMAFGVPVICSKTGAGPELMGNNERGILLADYRPETLLCALELVLNEFEGAVRKAKAARHWVETHHCLSVNAKALAENLHEVSGR